jgi:type IV secretory pathway VirB10-like protein
MNDAPDLTWLVERRSKIQAFLLKLYMFAEKPPPGVVDLQSGLFQLLVGTAFSLWRAVFLVYDTATGRHLLVPQGATIGGRDHGSTLLYGNERLPTTSLALTIGDRTYDLGQAPMMDQLGTNGLTGEVDQHYWRLFGAIFIGGALRGGQQMLQMEMAQTGGAGQIATGIAGLGNQAASQRIGRALDTRPTIKVFSGQQCQVLLIKALQLPSVWQTPAR